MSQEAGYDFERRWARIFGVAPQRGSGNQWYAKLDVGDAAFLWSLKQTDARSFTLRPEHIWEAHQAVYGASGRANVLPGLALDIQGEQLTVIRARDFLTIVTEELSYVKPDKRTQERRLATTPQLLRGEGE